DLEQDVVRGENEEARDRDRRDRESTLAEEEDADDEDADEERGLDHEVDDRGGEARADAGQRELEVHTFRGRDRDAILVLHTMKLDAFLKERQPAWAELETLVRQAGRKPQRLEPDRIRRLGALYRSAAADLALA